MAAGKKKIYRNERIEIPCYIDTGRFGHKRTITAMVTNDERGKTVSLEYNDISFTFPFEPLEKYLK